LRPNVLVIYPDEHRFDCLGAYGNEEIRTPHIDRLAENGVLFRESHCTYPICTPSRYSLLSGLYVHEHRGWTNESTLSPAIDTFPRLLGRAGYHTKAVGKMHFTPTYLDVGFEEMVLAEQCGDGRWDDDYHRHLMEHGLVDGIDLIDQTEEFRDHATEEYVVNHGAVVSSLPEEHHSTTWIGDRAVETLEQWGASGNLLMVGFIQPHHPFNPPPSWAQMYDPEGVSILPGWTAECPREAQAYRDLTAERMKRITAYYYAMISHIDHEVGRMCEVLQNKGIYDNTMIVFTSDHGDYMGFHHMLRKVGYVYDTLLKVPLIIKYPGSCRKGMVCDELVSSIDLAPTILRQAGCEIPDRMKGLDLAAMCKGRDYVFAERGHGNQRVIRSRDRKLIVSATPHLKSQFFDLESDPYEFNNLFEAPERQEEIARYKSILTSWRNQENCTENYVDCGAPLIQQPNVASHRDGHREQIHAYYRKIMDRLREER